MPEKKRFSVAVIGVGNMGQHHARIFAGLPECELVAVCDSNGSRVEEIAQRLKTKAFSDYKKMLSMVRPEIVSIAAPTSLHKEIAAEALKFSHVLIEKPVARNIEEANEIRKAAEKNQRTVMVGHIERFNPAIQYLKKYIQENNERVLALDFFRVGPIPPANPSSGVLTDLAIHDIDLTRFITEEEVIEAVGSVKSFELTPFEDHIHVFLKTGHATASIVSNWVNPRKLRRLLVTLQRAFLEINLLEQEITIFEKNQDDFSREGNATTVRLAREEPLLLEIKSFLETVEGKRTNPVTVEDASKTLAIAEALLKKESLEKIAVWKNNFFMHPTAEVQGSVGKGTKVWHEAQVCKEAIIGENCVLGKGVYIGPRVRIGNNVKIQNRASVYEGVEIEDDVFVGPHVTFTNDKYPRAFNKEWKVEKTRVKKGASIGANSTILCGITIGEFALVAAGSVVTKDVPAFSLVQGNPAQIAGRVCRMGHKMEKNQCPVCGEKK